MITHILKVYRVLFKDLGLPSCDYQYLRKRTLNEGLSFLTVTLPKVAKSILARVEHGTKISTAVRTKRARFLKRYLSAIENGSQDATMIKLLRQLLEYVYKLAIAYTPKQKAQFALEYLTREDIVGKYEVPFTLVDRLRKILFTRYADIMRATPDDIFSGKSSLRISSGKPNIKTRLSPLGIRWASDVFTRSYPKSLRGYSNLFLSDHRLPENKRVCRVLFVQKDSRGPRVISSEPYRHLQAQLRVFDFLSERIAKLSGGFISFDDQSRAGELALRGSTDRSLCTLDLSNASDMLSNRLVRELFNGTPLGTLMQRIRSTHYDLDGKISILYKFGNMGGGMTFVIMALVIGLAVELNVPRRLMHLCSVYGDDIIVPSKYMGDVVKTLTELGFVVNSSKSYSVSLFRESCGCDYYKGVDVSICRLKHDISDTSPRSLKRTYAHAWELFEKGYLETSKLLFSFIEQQVGESLYFRANPAVAHMVSPFGSVTLSMTKLFGFRSVHSRVNTSGKKFLRAFLEHDRYSQEGEFPMYGVVAELHELALTTYTGFVDPPEFDGLLHKKLTAPL